MFGPIVHRTFRHFSSWLSTLYDVLVETFSEMVAIIDNSWDSRADHSHLIQFSQKFSLWDWAKSSDERSLKKWQHVVGNFFPSSGKWSDLMMDLIWRHHFLCYVNTRPTKWPYFIYNQCDNEYSRSILFNIRPWSQIIIFSVTKIELELTRAS